MNETRISDFARSDSLSQGTDGSQLRPVLWTELTARLAAMRDLRQSLAGGSTPFGAKSASLSGSHICSAFTDFAEVRENLAHESPEICERVGVNKMGGRVNLKALADSKGPAPNNAIDLIRITPGDRELK